MSGKRPHAQEILIAAGKLHSVALNDIGGIGIDAVMGREEILVHVLFEIIQSPILSVYIDGNESGLTGIEIEPYHRLACE